MLIVMRFLLFVVSNHYCYCCKAKCIVVIIIAILYITVAFLWRCGSEGL